MIGADQPTIFPRDVSVHVSSSVDGTMLDRNLSIHAPEVVANRRLFCESIGVKYDNVVFQQIIYDENQTYTKLTQVEIHSASRSEPQVPADGIVTIQSGVGIMIPVADCVATVVFDPGTRQLVMLHLGRHSSVTPLLKNTLSHMTEHGSNIEDILVWMCPSAQQASYRLKYFDQAGMPSWKPFCLQKPDGIYVDLSGFNRQVCLDAGIEADHIEVSSVDTCTSKNYFSHSRGDATKRFAVVAMMH